MVSLNRGGSLESYCYFFLGDRLRFQYRTILSRECSLDGGWLVWIVRVLWIRSATFSWAII